MLNCFISTVFKMEEGLHKPPEEDYLYLSEHLASPSHNETFLEGKSDSRYLKRENKLIYSLAKEINIIKVHSQNLMMKMGNITRIAGIASLLLLFFSVVCGAKLSAKQYNR